MENIFAVEALLNREDAAVLIGVDHGYIEPLPLCQKLQIARAIGLDV
jgi:hypothetical protein